MATRFKGWVMLAFVGLLGATFFYSRLFLVDLYRMKTKAFATIIKRQKYL